MTMSSVCESRNPRRRARGSQKITLGAFFSIFSSLLNSNTKLPSKMSDLSKFTAQIDSNKSKLIQRLADAVAIPSVSGDASYRPHVDEMAHWLVKELDAIGATSTLKELGHQTMEGKQVKLPPAILSDLGSDPKKKTILIYGHYDVQPALRSDDGWKDEPFKLVVDEKAGTLTGRGSTDDKGPILGWINAVEAHKQAGIDLPVNLKFCFEGMEESGSIGLDALIEKEKDNFFKGVDAVCISDNYWLGTKKPCLTHGLRGISYYTLSISGPAADLHSGVFGGVVSEPLVDLFHIMSQLVTPKGEILVPGIKELVTPLTDEELARYQIMEFTIDDINGATGSKTTFSDEKETVLMGRMRYPSLSLHGVEGAFSAPGGKTVIPAKVKGKFSLRLVPDMTPDKVEELVKKYVNDLWSKLGSKNTMQITAEPGGKPWLADPNHWNYTAAIQATEKVYGVKPDLTREGGSIPVTLTFADTLNKNVLLLPMGRADDGAHSAPEKLDISNYIEGTKLLGTYLHEIASVAK